MYHSSLHTGTMSGASSFRTRRTAIDKSTGPVKPAETCIRTTRSSTRPVKTTASTELDTVTHPVDMSNQRGPCASCHLTVSPKVQFVVCRFCGMCVHANCDPTLTQVSIELLNSDSHPAVFYHCSNCRSLESTHCKNSLENRLVVLEAQLNKLREQVHPLISDFPVKTNYRKDSNCNKTYFMNSEPVEITSKFTEDIVEPKSFVEVIQNNQKRVSVPPKSITKSPYRLSVICTNIKEPNDTLLQARQKHDREEWLGLCQKMQLKPIEPVSLTRLSRSPNSPNKGKPRLLRITVETEKDLEDILLSAFLLQNSDTNSERVFADVPWWERSQKSDKVTKITRTDDRSLIILGVPENEETSDKKLQNKHDFLQWKFLSDTIQANNVAVVDTFRIPKSPKYMGSGPRPLKLTLLRSEMLGTVKTQWERYRNILPKEIRLSSSIRTRKPSSSTYIDKPLDEGISHEGEPAEQNKTNALAKNYLTPTHSESVPL